MSPNVPNIIIIAIDIKEVTKRKIGTVLSSVKNLNIVYIYIVNLLKDFTKIYL